MINVECESCVKRKTMYCPNSFKCYATKDKPYWQNRIMLLEENNQLKEKYANAVADYEEQKFNVEELKKQLEEYKYHLNCAKEMLEVQGRDGNYNYDSYTLGLYNGMEYTIALFETREPIFKSGKDIEFISDKTQQKEFINKIKELETKLKENGINE